MKIGFDFDGVIADCGALKSFAAKKLYNNDIPSKNFNKDYVIENKILTSSQYKYLQEVIYSTEDIGLSIKPVKDAFKSISILTKHGNELKVITSRKGPGLKIEKQWCTNNNLSIEIISVANKDDKSKSCKGLDIFIDDGIEMLIPLVGVVPHRLLFSWDYNKYVDVGNIAKRVHSWKEILKFVHDLRFNSS